MVLLNLKQQLLFLTHQTAVYDKHAAIKEISPHSNDDGDHYEYHGNGDRYISCVRPVP